MRISLFLGLTCASLLLLHCSAASDTSSILPPGGDAGASDGGAAGSGPAGASGAPAGGAAQGGAGSGGAAGGTELLGGGGSPSTDVIIYGHTNSTLYQLDPKSAMLDATKIGDFECIGHAGQDTSMTDLAVDKDLNLWGISKTGVYRLKVEGSTVKCGNKITLDAQKNVAFYGLTFAPVGTLDPAKETLVASNTAGELWIVDESGSLTLKGNFGKVPKNDGHGHNYDKANVGKTWELSGDIVFLANNGKPVGYATVRDCPNPPSDKGCNTVNTLIEIDVAKLASATDTSIVTKSIRGQIVPSDTCQDTTSDYGAMFGIAAWGAHVYGFSKTGNLVDMSIKDGSACLVRNYPSTTWAGAGVTTVAPVDPPIN
jgi:hypothetical protein